jgi:septin family protein
MERLSKRTEQLKDFFLTKKLKQWVDKPDKTLVLVGDSGVGKTAFCNAFIKEKQLKALLVNHKQDFRRLDASYDAILIDDAGICGISDTELLALIDNKAGKTIRVLYNSVLKKKNLVQMLVMNEPEFQSIAYQLAQRRFACQTPYRTLAFQIPFSVRTTNCVLQLPEP